MDPRQTKGIDTLEHDLDKWLELGAEIENVSTYVHHTPTMKAAALYQLSHEELKKEFRYRNFDNNYDEMLALAKKVAQEYNHEKWGNEARGKRWDQRRRAGQ